MQNKDRRLNDMKDEVVIKFDKVTKTYKLYKNDKK